jgi:hypothetical protein
LSGETNQRHFVQRGFYRDQFIDGQGDNIAWEQVKQDFGWTRATTESSSDAREQLRGALTLLAEDPHHPPLANFVADPSGEVGLVTIELSLQSMTGFS